MINLWAMSAAEMGGNSRVAMTFTAAAKSSG
jgi:hypothetical protein